MAKKILLVSPNSPTELSGGGIYLRTLMKVFSSRGALTIIAKSSSNDLKLTVQKYIQLRKTLFSDLVSRVFFQPTFLAFYIFRIISHIRNHDIIVFHNSRCGGLIWLTRVLFKKTTICSFDNVEKNVVSGSKSTSTIKWLMDCFDGFTLKLIEKLSYVYSNGCTFITKADCQYFEGLYGVKDVTSIIIPVSIPPSTKCEIPIKCNSKPVILFTASFDFPPNQQALRELLPVAQQFNSLYTFAFAGRSLQKFNSLLSQDSNISFHSDPTNEEMALLFNTATYYISPVSSGSGMKTKVAEAISYGLPVISTEHSLIGYEKIIDSSFIFKYNNNNELNFILHMLSKKTDLDISETRNNAIASFEKFYSDDAVIYSFRESSWSFI